MISRSGHGRCSARVLAGFCTTADVHIAQFVQVIEEKLTLLHIIASHEAFISGRRSRAMYAGIVKVNRPGHEHLPL